MATLAALLHLVPLLPSRQAPVACSWLLPTGSHMSQGHRTGSLLWVSRGQEDFCCFIPCLTPFLWIGIAWLQWFLTLGFWDNFFDFHFLFVSEFETMSGQQENMGWIFCKLIHICFVLKTQASHYQSAFQYHSGPRSGLSKINKQYMLLYIHIYILIYTQIYFYISVFIWTSWTDSTELAATWM